MLHLILTTEMQIKRIKRLTLTIYQMAKIKSDNSNCCEGCDTTELQYTSSRRIFLNNYFGKQLGITYCKEKL